MNNLDDKIYILANARYNGKLNVSDAKLSAIGKSPGLYPKYL